MTTAEPGHTMPCAGSNVVAFPVPSDTYITPLMLTLVQQEAAAVLPAGWFEILMDEDRGAAGRFDHVFLARVAGPPVGHFGVLRDRGRYVVEVVPEHDEDGRDARLGRFKTIAEAVQAVLAGINARLAAWSLPPLAPKAA